MSQVAIALLLALAGRQAPVAELPFELVGNHIYVKGHAGTRPVSVLLDSGAGLSVFDSGLAEAWNLPRTKEGVQVRGAGEGAMRAEMLTDFSVKLDDTSIEQKISLGIPLGPLKYLEGRPLEAVFGFEFFKKYVVEIDYAKNKVRFFDPATFAYKGGGKTIPIRIVANHPRLEGEVEIAGVGKLPVELMIDTGAGSGVSLTGRLVQKEKLNDRLPPSPSVPTGAGVGGATNGRMARIDGITLGGFRLNKPVASVDLGSGGVTGNASGFDVLVGGDIMRRFTVTFDYSRNAMHLEPNASFDTPFPGDQTGLLVKAEGDDLRTFRVMFVVDGSPAKELGIQPGDRLVEIDGTPVAQYELYQLRLLLRTPGKSWKLKLERDQKVIEITLKGRPLI